MMAYNFTHRSVAESLYLSLNDEPFYTELVRSISSDPAKKQEALTIYFDYSIKEGQAYGKVVIPEGKTYGASIWMKPTKDAISQQIFQEKSDFIRQHLGETSLKKYVEITGFMSENAKTVVPPESWYLSILGITPDMQGKGLGGALVEPVLKMIDAKGVPSYLETYNHRNFNFYQRLGYRGVASFTEPLTESEYWIMVRKPSPGIKHK